MFDDWFEKVEKVSEGHAWLFYDALVQLYDEDLSAEKAWAKVSEGWDGDDGLRNVAAFLQAQNIPPPAGGQNDQA